MTRSTCFYKPEVICVLALTLALFATADMQSCVETYHNNLAVHCANDTDISRGLYAAQLLQECIAPFCNASTEAYLNASTGVLIPMCRITHVDVTIVCPAPEVIVDCSSCPAVFNISWCMSTCADAFSCSNNGHIGTQQKLKLMDEAYSTALCNAQFETDKSSGLYTTQIVMQRHIDCATEHVNRAVCPSARFGFQFVGDATLRIVCIPDPVNITVPCPPRNITTTVDCNLCSNTPPVAQCPTLCKPYVHCPQQSSTAGASTNVITMTDSTASTPSKSANVDIIAYLFTPQLGIGIVVGMVLMCVVAACRKLKKNKATPAAPSPQPEVHINQVFHGIPLMSQQYIDSRAKAASRVVVEMPPLPQGRPPLVPEDDDDSQA